MKNNTQAKSNRKAMSRLQRIKTFANTVDESWRLRFEMIWEFIISFCFFPSTVRTQKPRKVLWFVPVDSLRGIYLPSAQTLHLSLQHLIVHTACWCHECRLSLFSASWSWNGIWYWGEKVSFLCILCSWIVTLRYPMFMDVIWDVCDYSEPFICKEDTLASYSPGSQS